ncbi:hypothetical protein ColLi_09177 [Colletotrichum liriopes]|uniref:Uncharacterized protein n=1 Tax=Colletotrichum liriopes TaxID=708192 RepID=A0AA37GSB6_9PEZI|nr:hypothetical protein ColLi_09177 [Colletotrichum liriopes]
MQENAAPDELVEDILTERQEQVIQWRVFEMIYPQRGFIELVMMMVLVRQFIFSHLVPLLAVHECDEDNEEGEDDDEEVCDASGDKHRIKTLGNNIWLT